MLGKEKEEMVQLRKRIEGVYLRRDRHTGELETTQTSKHTQTSADMQQNVSERLFFRTQHRSQKTGIEPALCTLHSESSIHSVACSNVAANQREMLRCTCQDIIWS